MSTIKLDLSEMSNSTLAAIVKDLAETDSNIMNIRGIIHQLENNVGEEDAIEYLAGAGVTPEMLAQLETQ